MVCPSLTEVVAGPTEVVAGLLVSQQRHNVEGGKAWLQEFDDGLLEVSIDSECLILCQALVLVHTLLACDSVANLVDVATMVGEDLRGDLIEPCAKMIVRTLLVVLA